MKKAARIVFKVESILFIVGLACTAIAALIVSLFIPQIFEGFKDPNNWHPQPAYVSDETAAAMTALCVSGVYIGLVVCILGTIFTLLGIKKIDTARNKKEHNHPSGNCEPSEEDLHVTDQLKKVSVIMGIELLDHVIVSREAYFSFLENKLLPD